MTPARRAALCIADAAYARAMRRLNPPLYPRIPLTDFEAASLFPLAAARDQTPAASLASAEAYAASVISLGATMRAAATFEPQPPETRDSARRPSPTSRVQRTG